MYVSSTCLLLTLYATVKASIGQRERLFSSAFAIPGSDAEYDYVVVGGGTSGLTIASKLAEDPSVTVAVVEAGGFYEHDNGNFSVVPGLAQSMTFLATTPDHPKQPLMDWGFVSEPQVGAKGRRIHYAQGKTFGGSSALNTMAYLRSTKGAHKRWAEHVGDKSYEFDNMLKFFMKSVHLTPPDLKKRDSPNATVKYDPSAFNNSLGGPLQVSWGNYVDPIVTFLQNGLQSIGLPISSEGFNSGKLQGYTSWFPSTISPAQAKRSTSRTSYLAKAIRSTTLMLYPRTQALKLLFDDDNNGPPKATGVSVSTMGLEYKILARKEIVLSAGVFQSPHLLMLSGIGPGSTLKSLGIKVVSDLPGVGRNLWDQIFFGIGYNVKETSAAQILADPAVNARILQQYLDDAAGPFSSPDSYIGFDKIPPRLRKNFSNETRSSLRWFPSDWPEVEYIASGSVDSKGRSMGILSACLSAPLSRGSVTIQSASASDPPVINMGWLTDPADKEVAIAAFKQLRLAWSGVKEVQAGPEIYPGLKITSDEAILDYIRGSVSQIWHASSTCAMGKSTDKMAVVDSEAKVFGVQGLRVVDISAIPFALPGHPQSTVYALAEKIAYSMRGKAL